MTIRADALTTRCGAATTTARVLSDSDRGCCSALLRGDAVCCDPFVIVVCRGQYCTVQALPVRRPARVRDRNTPCSLYKPYMRVLVTDVPQRMERNCRALAADAYRPARLPRQVPATLRQTFA